MKIVSVQDISCFGQCSLTVALPVLSAYGIETAILPSGILSTHTGGFKSFTVHDLTDEMPKIIEKWIEAGIKFDAIYTGYIGDARQFDMVLEMKKTLLNPGGKLIVDPAMADHGKMYAALGPEIVDGMKKIAAAADLILPNLTEAAFLLGEEYKDSYTKPEIEGMLKKLAAMGAECAILTGVSYTPDKLGAVAYTKATGEFTEYFAEYQPKSYHGTGDIFSSVAIAGYMNGEPLSKVLEDSCEFIVKCIKKTMPDESHWYGVKFEEVLAER